MSSTYYGIFSKRVSQICKLKLQVVKFRSNNNGASIENLLIEVPLCWILSKLKIKGRCTFVKQLIPSQNSGHHPEKVKMKNKRILLIGGCGSMGTYLTELLLKTNNDVDIATNVPGTISAPNLKYILTDARDLENLKKLLSAHYDGVIDFLDYAHADYLKRYRLFLENCGHYIFLSSYRVYADRDKITTENSPLQRDVSEDEEFRTSGDYSIYKAQNEDLLRQSVFSNWTIVRPSIVFSRMSFPLVSFGALCIWNRAMEHRPTLMPDVAVDVCASCTWSGDLAKLFHGVLFNSKCMKEAYTFSTAEYLTWGEFAKLYRELIGLETWTIPLAEYEKIRVRAQWSSWQLHYDRLFHRRMDNSKVLKAIGMTQAEMTPVRKALELEFAHLDKNYRFTGDMDDIRNMDRYLAANGSFIRKF